MSSDYFQTETLMWQTVRAQKFDEKMGSFRFLAKVIPKIKKMYHFFGNTMDWGKKHGM